MTKSTRRALFSSVVALVLCLTMLIGTTFAWFTDTASTAVNTIVSGTLDVKLLDKEGNPVEGKTLDFVKAEGNEDEAILWEPGCTYNLEPVTIKNDGNLALKYTVVVSGINGDAKLNEAIEWTISDVKNEVATTAETGDAAETVKFLLPDEFATLTISGHMKEDAGNEYQGLTIEGAAITVYATQYTYEYDSNGNQYDANATLPSVWDGKTTTEPTLNVEDGKYHITSAAEFAAYINALNNEHRYTSANVVLDCDIDLAGYTFEVAREGYAFSGSFDGQGHTVSNFTVKRTDSANYTGLFSVYMWNGGEIKNLTVKNGTVISNGAQVAAIVPSLNDSSYVDNCKAVDCTVIGEKKVGAIAGYAQAGGTVSNCSAENCNVYCSDSREGQATVYGFNNEGIFTNNAEPVNCTVVYGVTNVADGVVLNNGVYEIYNADGMFWFAGLDTTEQLNKNITLVADIDLGYKAWTPINNFTGTLDGNGHTIYNLKVTAPADASSNSGFGLIGWSYGTIKNLTVDGAKVSANHNAAVICGYLEKGTIENCHVKNATVDCTYADNDKDGDKAGTIVGNVNAGAFLPTVANCTAENCKVIAERDAGQIAGCAKESVVTGCTATDVDVSFAGTGKNVNIRNEVIGRVIG